MTETSVSPVAPARRVMLARRSDPPLDPTVHVLPLPLSERRYGDAAVAYCAATLPVDSIEAVDPERGGGDDWCVLCFSAYTTNAPPAPVPGTSPFSTGTADGRAEAARTYLTWGWPVTSRGDQLWLAGPDTLGLVLPVIVASAVTDLLVTRRCVPAVLAHPAVPSHRILLATERYPVPLGWPRDVHRITTGVLLPPTGTAAGPVWWARAPQPDSLALCREIDVLGALRAVRAG